jgi:hypothetical protein
MDFYGMFFLRTDFYGKYFLENLVNWEEIFDRIHSILFFGIYTFHFIFVFFTILDILQAEVLFLSVHFRFKSFRP